MERGGNQVLERWKETRLTSDGRKAIVQAGGAGIVVIFTWRTDLEDSIFAFGRSSDHKMRREKRKGGQYH